MATDEKIKHSTRKVNNAKTLHEQVGKDEERQRGKLDNLRRDLISTQRAADEAAGATESDGFRCTSHAVSRGSTSRISV